MLIIDCNSYYIKKSNKKQSKKQIKYEKMPIFKAFKIICQDIDINNITSTKYRNKNIKNDLCKIKN